MSIDKTESDISFIELDEIRDSLLRKNLIKKFLDTYHVKIKNLNTSRVWDEKFHKTEKVEDQDGMTKEKITYISNYLSNLNQPIKLLDIGIGQAYVEQKLKNNNVKIKLSAIDISELSIRRAKKKYKAVGVIDDALNMNKYFKPNSFDAIVAIEVIEHISPNKIFNFYKKVYSLLKENGIFIISTPLNEGLRFMSENPNAHVREYTPDILRAEFKLSNYKILKEKTLIAFPKFYILKRSISKILPNHWKPNNIIIVAKKI